LDARIKKRMRQIAGESVSFNVPMSQHTTFKAGGTVEAMYRARNLEGLKEMMAFLMHEGIPHLIIGRGSNLLVRDRGLNGIAIILDGAFTSIEHVNPAEPYVLAGAGLPLHKLVDFCTKKGLAGAEFLAGIPGTVGGGVAMNAGSGGEEIKALIRKLKVLTRSGVVERRDSSSLAFQYRALELYRGEIILYAGLTLKFDKPASISKRVTSNMNRRNERFPLDMPSAGSTFKNPDGDHAGRLIDAAGLKGRRIGGAMISPKHANFIVNAGRASASDIVALMDLARTKVHDMFNIQLVPEIKIVGKG
jgi:UDP-N-acetylmuramate dehydrogenase